VVVFDEEISYNINYPDVCSYWTDVWGGRKQHGKMYLPRQYNMFAIGMWG
jgi:hypothetical protein